MEISQKICLARKKKGLTQEELADRANVTVRTIQRIESGENHPRAFTIKALADALEIPFEDLAAEKQVNNNAQATGSGNIFDPAEENYFLKTLCLSCFSYLIIPLVHFLLPAFLLKKSGNHHSQTITFARRMIRQQIYWVVMLCIILILTLAYNFIISTYFQKEYLLHYLVPFFIMYFLNLLLILKNLGKIDKKLPVVVSVP
jgi:transcriptional regulator with XRE-family HTH domain